MNIYIKTIPHKQQRYRTFGDWWFDDTGDLQIRVTDFGNWKAEALIALHELVEVLLCKDRGIQTETVDNFDIAFEKERDKGIHGKDDEPGDDPYAPYKREHFFATNIERLVAAELNFDWINWDYEGLNP